MFYKASPSLFLLFIVAFLMSGCGGDAGPPDRIDPEFREYVSAYTSDAISRKSSIRVRLLEPIQDEEERERILEKALFSFDPHIEGKTEWQGPRTIAFVPDEPLPSGTEFHASFELSAVLDVPEKLNTLEFGLRTIEQDLRVHVDGFDLYDMEMLERQMLKGILKTADVADKKEVEKSLRATQGGEELKIRWDHDVDGKTHHFTVDSVKRKEEEDSVELAWDGAPIGVGKEDRISRTIPALGDFKIMSVDMKKKPEQHLLIRFSDPLDQEQDLNGILRLADGPSLRTSISGNEVKAYPREAISGEGTVKVSGSIENIMGHRMEEDFSRTVLFEDLKPQVKMLGSGTILPDSDGLHLPFKAVNLSAVDLRLIKIFEGNIPQFFQVNRIGEEDELRRVAQVVHTERIELSEEELEVEGEGRWNSYNLDLGNILEQKGKGAIYRVELSFPKAYSKYPCNDGDEEDRAKLPSDEENGFLSKEMGSRSGGYYDHSYSWREKDDPCSEAFYYGRRTVESRNVFASNIGLLAKKGEKDRLFCAANDLRSSKPISNARIKVLDYQQRSIGVGKTDDKGKAKISVEGDPYLLIAEKDGEKGYLRVDGSSSLSTSEFDVSGKSLKEGLKGFLYPERGVHRPGDTIHLSFILDDREMPLPAEHPVELEVTDARNNTAHREVQENGKNGFYYFPIPTSKEDPTGNWRARVRVGGAEFSERLRVETIKPNRLRIDIDWDEEVLEAGNDGGTLRSSWLHGATAKGLKAEIEADLSVRTEHFAEEAPAYLFEDPIRSFHSGTRTIFDGRLNEEGEAAFQCGIDVGDAAPGMLQASFTTRVFEKSGNSSVDRQRKSFSPYNDYIGLKMPDSRNRWGYLKTGEDHRFHFKALNKNGEPVPQKPVQVKLYRIERDWWYDHSRGRDLGDYISKTHHEPVRSERLSTDSDGNAEFEVHFDEDIRWGHYLIRASDAHGEHATGKTFSVSRYGRPPEGEGDDASLLALGTDQEKYEVGDKATLTIPSGGVGRILVSLENGTDLMETHWVEAKADSTRFSFEVTEAMTPNIYAHATLIQPHGQEANELPNRLFGVEPIEVYDPATELDPELEMPEELGPEQRFELEVSEAEGKAMTYTLAIVDEGLLDLTSFETPAPWDHFYAKEAHGVKTWDLYDDVMGARSGQLRNILAVGGGGEAKGKDKGNVDRFKPMVRYIGPFDLNNGSSRKHELRVPNYIGSVRTMLVAGREGAYGSTEERTPVKEPLMVLSTLPRVIGPKEKLQVPVSVFAMEESVQNVELEVRTNEFFSPDGAKRKRIEFSEPGEKLVSFDLDVEEGIGKGEVEVIARSGDEEARHQTELKVRNPNPEVTDAEGTVLSAGESWESEMELPGMAGTNSGVLELSSIPPMDSERRIEKLIRYPHGCVEQVVSSAFPQLYLDRLSEISAKEKARIDEHVQQALEKLRSFQNSGGGFSYWPGHHRRNDWGTSYAGHFILEAKEKGYAIPGGLEQEWLEAQSSAARNWDPMERDEPGYRSRRDLQQAYRLYTLALADEAVLSAMNRLRRSKTLSVQARWRLAAAYHLAGQHDAASELVEGAKSTVGDYREMSYTYGSSERDRAMILETMSLMGMEDEGSQLVRELAEALRSDRWLSTQTTAYSLLAISKFLGEEGSSDHMSYSYSFGSGKSGEESTQLPISRVELGAEELQEGNKVRVKNEGEGKLFVRSILSGKPAQGKEKAASNRLRMEVEFTDLDGDPIDVTQLEQGTDFIGEVRVGNPGSMGDYDEMALTRIFPSGWEIRGKRLGDGDLTESRKAYEDVRDDRVLTYFDLDANEGKRFRVRLHAAYPGRFYLPAAYCEAMYDGTINARDQGQWVEVVKPGALSADARTQ